MKVEKLQIKRPMDGAVAVKGFNAMRFYGCNIEPGGLEVRVCWRDDIWSSAGGSHANFRLRSPEWYEPALQTGLIETAMNESTLVLQAEDCLGCLSYQNHSSIRAHYPPIAEQAFNRYGVEALRRSETVSIIDEAYRHVVLQTKALLVDFFTGELELYPEFWVNTKQPYLDDPLDPNSVRHATRFSFKPMVLERLTVQLFYYRTKPVISLVSEDRQQGCIAETVIPIKI